MKTLLKFLVFIHARLPLSVNRFLGRCYGRFIYYFSARLKHTTEKNLSVCFSEWDAANLHRLTKESCRHTGMAIAESLWIWGRKPSSVFKKISVVGQELIDDALSSGAGVILTGLHMGCWELITNWSGQYYSSYGFYRSLKKSSLDGVIKRGRSQTGAHLIAATRSNVKVIIDALKQPNVFIVLADQEPKRGSGVYAPFFGRPAYTMTLPYQLAKKTGARILGFDILRTEAGWTLTISDISHLAHCETKEQFAVELNLIFAQIIGKNIAQFEWSYKRFKTPFDGNYDFYQ